MNDLPKFKALKPVGKCEPCGRDLYAHSVKVSGCTDFCPLMGDEWARFRLRRDLQNCAVSVPDVVESGGR